MKKSVFVTVFFFFTFYLMTQELPRIAVVPFNPIGVSSNEAIVITGLFETGLVKTESFNVIEQNQIQEIMKAQSYTLTGYTDESSAIEMGKLLAAEQIVLGELSSIGRKFILNAKIIDVEAGRNIKADKVEASGMEEMTEAAELLAFKLAGLTYSSGGSARIAETFGEVLIITEPQDADIYINGVKKGVSPNLFSRIPLGTIRVEAKKGNMYAIQEIDVNEETARIKLNLKEQYGDLFIKSSVPELKAYLNGEELGELDTGFFEELLVGDHELELRGKGLYWSGDITIAPEKSTRVEAVPRQYGRIRYKLPEDAEAVVTGTQYRRIIRSAGVLDPVWVGTYNIRLIGEKYEPLEKEVQVERGVTVIFSPEPSVSPEYLKMRFTEELHSLRELIDRDVEMRWETIRRVQTLLQGIEEASYDFNALKTEGEELSREAHTAFFLPKVKKVENYAEKQVGNITEEMVSEGRELETRILEASINLPGFERRVEEALSVIEKKFELQGLYTKREELESGFHSSMMRRRAMTSGGYVGLGGGALGAGLAVLFALLSNSTYGEYQSATLSSDAAAYHGEVAMYDTLTIVSAGIGVVSAGVSLLLFALRPPNREEYQAQINELSEEIHKREEVRQ